MRVTLFGHCCLLVELSDAKILVDPGNLSEVPNAIAGLTDICITHHHPDHLDSDKIGPIIASHPDCRLWADHQSCAILGAKWSPVEHGSKMQISKNVTATIFGKSHHPIHRDIPSITNIGYYFNDTQLEESFFYPGDAFTIVSEPVTVAAVPAAAPWMTVQDGADYIDALQPTFAVGVHTGVLSPAGTAIHHRVLDAAARKVGVTYVVVNDQSTWISSSTSEI